MSPVFPQSHKSRKQSALSSKLTAAEAYTKEVDNFIKQNPKRKRSFAKISVNKNVPGKWREFKSQEELESAGTGDNLGENAVVWLRDGKTIGALLISEKRSRDWTQYVMYYFREDGTLVITKETFNTFYANISVERVRVYGSQGRRLHSSSKYFDLRTGEKKKPNGFASVPAPTYRRVRNLPFYALL
jgi:hypothetical protein